MRRRPLFWQIYLAFFLLALAAMLAIAWFGSHAARAFFMARTEQAIRQRALLFAPVAGDHLRAGDSAGLDVLCKTAGRESQTRLTIILPDGRVVADSTEDPQTMDNHRDRPEVKQALATGSGMERRWSHTVGREFMYVAVRLQDGAAVPGVIRAAMPVADFESSLHILYRHLAETTLLIILLVAAGAYLLARRISLPLREMQQVAERYAAGDFSARLRIAHSAEMDALAAALNRMADQLDERFRTIGRQRNEEQAILGSMTEGLIAVDAALRVLTLNAAAARTLGVRAEDAAGRSLLEIARLPSLHELLTRATQSDAPVEGEATLLGPDEVYLQVHAAPLLDASGQRIGAVAVWTDVTRLRRLENLRREFVANVSHELRTPITSIKGFVETLEDGAIDQPAEARRFVGIIARQADRLGAIIEDLLLLSRLDRGPDTNGLMKEPCRVADLLQGAVQSCTARAAEKQVTVHVAAVSADLSLDANASLLQQAIVNLLSNAVNYSERGAQIHVAADAAADEVRIAVQDWGCGIAPEHHERVFERFYRVDKARSRELGGTGLGLAIAKHIVQAHGGRVTVASALGKGSTFTLHLPSHPPATPGA